ncbi:MAG: dephospho-CoA kinase [Betaproteobacteria bacterium AqS2]|uniref:Dephospho-CoA kinase n=1 Tax=Candidatus Amphirhobacter heronislandensis TaxID=1732024 RepID=A0A930UFC4_9GAMM|nr:dephospho-CoA kinase [Betaproteobacteria bacterium AqS2]
MGMIPFVGLTGGIASGKSVAAAHFASQGVTVIDADDVGHSLYEAGGQAVPYIQREFGPDYVTEAGAVDRGALRGAVFKDPLLLKRLEAVTHPLIRKACLRQMNAAQGIYGLLVAPLLFESEFITETMSRFLVIDCEEEVQLRHAKERGGFTAEQVEKAMKAQMRRDERLKRADETTATWPASSAR